MAAGGSTAARSSECRWNPDCCAVVLFGGNKQRPRSCFEGTLYC